MTGEPDHKAVQGSGGQPGPQGQHGKLTGWLPFPLLWPPLPMLEIRPGPTTRSAANPGPEKSPQPSSVAMATARTRSPGLLEVEGRGPPPPMQRGRKLGLLGGRPLGLGTSAVATLRGSSELYFLREKARLWLLGFFSWDFLVQPRAGFCSSTAGWEA